MNSQLIVDDNREEMQNALQEAITEVKEVEFKLTQQTAKLLKEKHARLKERIKILEGALQVCV